MASAPREGGKEEAVDFEAAKGTSLLEGSPPPTGPTFQKSVREGGARPPAGPWNWGTFRHTRLTNFLPQKTVTSKPSADWGWCRETRHLGAQHWGPGPQGSAFTASVRGAGLSALQWGDSPDASEAPPRAPGPQSRRKGGSGKTLSKNDRDREGANRTLSRNKVSL